MKMPSKLVGIEQRPFQTVIRGAAHKSIRVEDNDLVCLTHISYPDGNAKLSFEAKKTGRGMVTILVDDVPYEVPAVVFHEREFFVCLTISCNYHVGFDPEAYIIGVQEDGRIPEGHGFRKVCRTLTEPHVHALGLPITWLIDSTVAFVGRDDFRRWHTEFYDDFGVMPPSYIHDNAVNYNLTMNQEELTAYLGAEINRVEDQIGWSTDVVGIDQYIGSIDNLFAAACENLGIRGLWGMGFDHFECDTSMYHRGCPWDCYKINAANVRIPARYPTDLWAFQWTQRDLINTMKTPTGPSGSVMFSTDADDIRVDGIMAAQPDYYNRKLQSAYESYVAHPDNDFGVFLMHQEDHDTGFEDNNLYWGNFLRNISQPVTYATINEITEWLNLKYDKTEHPAQCVLARDVLTCKEKVRFWDAIQRPDDWGPYPPHIFYYDRDVQVAVEQGKRIPCRVFDYQEDIALPFGEIYPEKELPQASILSESLEDGSYTARILSDRPCKALPFVIEYADSQGNQHCQISRIDLSHGEQEVRIKMDPRAVSLL